MAGLGFNNRAMAVGGKMAMRKPGMGFGQERMETAEYEPGDRDAMFDTGPEMDAESDYSRPYDEAGDDMAADSGDAWSDVDETDFMSWLRTQPTDMTKFLLDSYRKRDAEREDDMAMPEEDRYGI